MVDHGGKAESAAAHLPEHGAQVLRLTGGCHELQRREGDAEVPGVPSPEMGRWGSGRVTAAKRR
jgi:hypothetical protein